MSVTQLADECDKLGVCVVTQQHVENKKLKRQSQMLLEKLNGVNKPLHDLLPDLADVPDETTEGVTDDSSVNQLNALVNKINSLFCNCLFVCLQGVFYTPSTFVQHPPGFVS